MLSRRRFLRFGAAAAASGLAGGFYATRIELHWLEIVRRVLPVAGLPAPLAGRTLLQVSDLHIGRRVSDAYVARVFERAVALEPDLVVYTGDFVSWYPPAFDKMRRLFERAPRGRLGTVGILGNHDYWRNWSHPEIADQVAAIAGAYGVRVLRNESCEIAGLQFAGLDDLWAGRFDARRALAGIDPARACVALSHNPDTADLEGWGGYRGWILAGHTHGGQVRLPFLPPPFLPVRNRRYAAGECAAPQGRRLYVSRGVGHLTPVRFNVRPEITLFTLAPAA